MKMPFQCFVWAVMAALALGDGEAKKLCIDMDVYKSKLQEASDKCVTNTTALTDEDHAGQKVLNCVVQAFGWADSDGKLPEKDVFKNNLKPFFLEVFHPKVEEIVDDCWTDVVQFSDIEDCANKKLKEVCDLEVSLD